MQCRGGEMHRLGSGTGEVGMELDDVHFQNLTDISDKIRRIQISPIAVTEALLDRIATYDGKYGSYITVLRERAFLQAATAADEIRRGFWRGPLHGIPLGLKDLCDTNFAPTAAGMPMRRTFVPAANATVVNRLEAAGAVILGKLSMSEGAFSEHRDELPVPTNPWNSEYWTGTSSSGSAVATSAGFCFGALASDTGGSIRYPAACQGITGLKPTWGRVSRHGIFPLAPTLDHVGPMARSVADCAAILAAIAGHDPLDPTAVQDSVPDYLGNIGGAIGGLRIGFDPASAHKDASPDVGIALARMLEVLAGLGARIVEITFPAVEDIVSAWVDLCACEAAAVHKDNFDAHAENYGAVLGGLIRRGRELKATDLANLLVLRQNFCGNVAAVFQSFDVLLTPVLSRGVPALADMEDPLKGRAWIRRYAAPFNLTGQPTITLPGGFAKNGLPVALQLVGRPFDESLLLQIGHAVQQRTDWHTRHPEIEIPL